jgi:hypothetical protein
MKGIQKMTEKELYLFDLQGYITVPNALNATQLAELNRLVSGQLAEHSKPDARMHRFSESLLGWGKVVRELIDNAPIAPYLEELIGRDYRLDHDYCDVIRSGTNTHASSLHGGGTPFDSCMFFNQHNGKMYNGLLVVAYNLHDVNPGDGGFGCVPGSHKSNYAFPEEWRELSKAPDCVRAVTGPAGTAIIFTEALTHGTLPWRGKHDRRTVFFKYSPPAISWHAQYYDEKKFEDLTPRQRAILEAPNARYTWRAGKP